MIKVLSKYLLDIPFVNPTTEVVCEFFTLEVYAYTGLKNQVDVPLVYGKTIKNPAGLNTNIEIDIANFITEFVPLNGACWVKSQVFYSDSPLVELQSIKLASKGYTYGTEAINQEATGILTTGLEHKIAREQTFVLKVLAEETVVPDATLTIVSITETTAPLYEIEWEVTETVIDIIVRYRLVGDTDWSLGFEAFTTSPTEVELPSVAGDYEVQIYGFDVVNNINVFSNIYEITIA